MLRSRVICFNGSFWFVSDQTKHNIFPFFIYLLSVHTFSTDNIKYLLYVCSLLPSFYFFACKGGGMSLCVWHILSMLNVLTIGAGKHKLINNSKFFIRLSEVLRELHFQLLHKGRVGKISWWIVNVACFIQIKIYKIYESVRVWMCDDLNGYYSFSMYFEVLRFGKGRDRIPLQILFYQNDFDLKFMRLETNNGLYKFH